eukprot:m.267444 g.267444  ORF g.267444 m.267444 type:complete len:766 (+) comp22804_c2_seq4:443-2740(+)
MKAMTALCSRSHLLLHVLLLAQLAAKGCWSAPSLRPVMQEPVLVNRVPSLYHEHKDVFSHHHHVPTTLPTEPRRFRFESHFADLQGGFSRYTYDIKMHDQALSVDELALDPHLQVQFRFCNASFFSFSLRVPRDAEAALLPRLRECTMFSAGPHYKCDLNKPGPLYREISNLSTSVDVVGESLKVQFEIQLGAPLHVFRLIEEGEVRFHHRDAPLRENGTEHGNRNVNSELVHLGFNGRNESASKERRSADSSNSCILARNGICDEQQYGGLGHCLSNTDSFDCYYVANLPLHSEHGCLCISPCKRGLWRWPLWQARCAVSPFDQCLDTAGNQLHRENDPYFQTLHDDCSPVSPARESHEATVSTHNTWMLYEHDGLSVACRECGFEVNMEIEYGITLGSSPAYYLRQIGTSNLSLPIVFRSDNFWHESLELPFAGLSTLVDAASLSVLGPLYHAFHPTFSMSMEFDVTLSGSVELIFGANLIADFSMVYDSERWPPADRFQRSWNMHVERIGPMLQLDNTAELRMSLHPKFGVEVFDTLSITADISPYIMNRFSATGQIALDTSWQPTGAGQLIISIKWGAETTLEVEVLGITVVRVSQPSVPETTLWSRTWDVGTTTAAATGITTTNAPGCSSIWPFATPVVVPSVEVLYETYRYNDSYTQPSCLSSRSVGYWRIFEVRELPGSRLLLIPFDFDGFHSCESDCISATNVPMFEYRYRGNGVLLPLSTGYFFVGITYYAFFSIKRNEIPGSGPQPGGAYLRQLL